MRKLHRNINRAIAATATAATVVLSAFAPAQKIDAEETPRGFTR